MSDVITFPMAHEEMCANCLYYEPKMTKGSNIATYGFCHRYPPQVVFDIDEAGKDNAWPATRPNEWCGEYLEHPANHLA